MIVCDVTLKNNSPFDISAWCGKQFGPGGYSYTPSDNYRWTMYIYTGSGIKRHPARIRLSFLNDQDYNWFCLRFECQTTKIS
jgi:hypothetical protein